MLHSLPLEFPLAMAFAEQLLSWKSEDGEGRSEDEPDTIPAPVLLQVVELLGEAYPPSGSGALGVREELVRWAGGDLGQVLQLFVPVSSSVRWGESCNVCLPAVL